jgi:hypothetical protein
MNNAYLKDKKKPSRLVWCNFLDLDSGSARFESLPEHQPFCLTAIGAFLNPSRRYSIIPTGLDRILQ